MALKRMDLETWERYDPGSRNDKRFDSAVRAMKVVGIAVPGALRQ